MNQNDITNLKRKKMKNVLMIAILSLCLSNMQAQVIDEGSMKKATGWVSEFTP